MKKNNSNKLIRATLALVVVMGVINALRIVMPSVTSQVAGLFNISYTSSQPRFTFGPNDNDFGAAEGISFKENQVLTIKACAAGGGGGGGGRGWEDGSSDGNGGGGGGGGGKGQCRTIKLKVRSGDIMHWNIGTGGHGGAGGVLDTFIDSNYPYEDSPAYAGENGGWTYVSINGIDVMQLEGGHGGGAGSNAYESGYASGGLGGSEAVANISWHRGQDGENPHWIIGVNGNPLLVRMGGGGQGGRGENNTNSGEPGTSGAGGTASGSDPYGGNGGVGTLTFGGGGGGGGAGRWYDYALYNDNYDNCIRQYGGAGGNGGNGYIEFYW